MGKQVDLATFGTEGPSVSAHKNKVPIQPQKTCWIRAIEDTCSDNEKRQIYKGLGVVDSGKWFPQPNGVSSQSSVRSLGNRPESPATHEDTHKVTPTTSNVPLTGVFTATRHPTPTSGASRAMLRMPSKRRQFSINLDVNSNKTGDLASGAKKGLIGGIASVGGLLTL